IRRTRCAKARILSGAPQGSKELLWKPSGQDCKDRQRKSTKTRIRPAGARFSAAFPINRYKSVGGRSIPWEGGADGDRVPRDESKGRAAAGPSCFPGGRRGKKWEREKPSKSRPRRLARQRPSKTSPLRQKSRRSGPTEFPEREAAAWSRVCHNG